MFQEEANALSVTSSMAAVDLFENTVRSRATTFSKKTDRPLFLQKKQQQLEQQQAVVKLSKLEEDQRNQGTTTCKCDICLTLIKLQARKDPNFTGNLHEDVDFLKLLLKKQAQINLDQELLPTTLSAATHSSETQDLSKSTSNAFLPKKILKKLSFKELIVLLTGPDPENVLGCPLHFPDTAFFEEGKVTDIIKTDKDGCLVQTKFDVRSALQEVRTSFSSIVRERKKESTIGEEQSESGNKSPNNPIKDFSSGVQSITVDNTEAGSSPPASVGKKKNGASKKNSPNNQQPQQQQSLQESSSCKESVLIRYRPKKSDPPSSLRDKCFKAVKIATESQFMAEFTRKHNDPYWNSLECIQTCVKSAQGLGKHFLEQFRAKIPQKQIYGDLERDLNYDFRGIGSEYEGEVLKQIEQTTKHPSLLDIQNKIEEKLRLTDPAAYCKRVCMKISHYLLQLYSIELLQMDADFHMDDNGKMWLFYARNVVVREPRVRVQMHDFKAAKPVVAAVNKSVLVKKKSLTHKEFLEDANVQRTLEKDNVQDLQNAMSKYYNKLKADVKVVEALESSGTDDESSKALKKLRPNHAIQSVKMGVKLKFRELIRKEEDKRAVNKYNNRCFAPIIVKRNEILWESIQKVTPQNEFIKRHRDKIRLTQEVRKYNQELVETTSQRDILNSTKQLFFEKFTQQNGNYHSKLPLTRNLGTVNSSRIVSNLLNKTFNDSRNYYEHYTTQASIQHKQSPFQTCRDQDSSSQSAKQLYCSQFLKTQQKIAGGAFQLQLQQTTRKEGVSPLMKSSQREYSESNRSTIKAQKDIRQLYTPPVKGLLFPSRNPFFNGSMVDYMPSTHVDTGDLKKNSINKSDISQEITINSTMPKLDKKIKARASYLMFASAQHSKRRIGGTQIRPTLYTSAYQRKVDTILERDSPYKNI
ncbi:hypothetical protein FGO68_gene12787 [Halteria grandinella]|uniref:Uncharacterized protein n=1 Tax=Halteria grandinella TaxID=5974 RepID=A0A8J8T791_HALGN|nr:hypothetical protein FGO68_gene12787 [Halteria grandinella]